MNKRKSGYYFVFPEDNDFWDIAYFNSNYNLWFMSGVTEEFNDKDFVKINENEITYEDRN